MKHESDDDISCNWYAPYSHQNIGTGTRWLGNKRTSGDLLHIDPWSSRQSKILCTGHTRENKRKKSGGWAEMCKCYEMIYADAHVWYEQSVRNSVWVWDSVLSGCASRWGSGLQQASGWESLSREVEKLLSGALKITQRGMVKRRSYGSI